MRPQEPMAIPGTSWRPLNTTSQDANSSKPNLGAARETWLLASISFQSAVCATQAHVFCYCTNIDLLAGWQGEPLALITLLRETALKIQSFKLSSCPRLQMDQLIDILGAGDWIDAGNFFMFGYQAIGWISKSHEIKRWTNCVDVHFESALTLTLQSISECVNRFIRP